jgi:thioesterase domain-containing protein
MQADVMQDSGPLSEDVAAQQSDQWVVAFRSAGATPPLFCVCAGGGDVFDYRDLAQSLPADLPVYGFGVPPLELLGDRFPSVQQLAAIYVAKLRTLQRQGPYYLCGHSFGGVVVYEMAVLLAKAGEQVGLVALIDTLHPAFRRNMSTTQRLRYSSAYMADRVTKYVRNLRRGKINEITRDIGDFVLHRCKRTFWKIARLVFGRLGGPIPGAINADEMILVSAWNRYQSTIYDGRVVLLNAGERPPEYGRDSTLGWTRYVRGEIKVHVVPGNHYSIMHPPEVEGLARQVVQYLAGH